MQSPYGNLRISASIAVGAKYLARPDSHSVGLLGTGRLAMVGLQGLCQVRPIDRVAVYSPTPEHRDRFAERAFTALGVSVAPRGSFEETIDGVDIIAMSTSSYTPVLRAEHLRPGVHVNGWGAPNEMDASVYLRADVCALYSRYLELAIQAPDPLRHQEVGPLHKLHEAGPLKASIVDIGSVVAGEIKAPIRPNAITVYRDARGGAGDAPILKLAYERALERGRGTELPL
jgi:ornithine cyclodeaminase/alanine dehydrogenase-like protein (mu-crystallin family)